MNEVRKANADGQTEDDLGKFHSRDKKIYNLNDETDIDIKRLKGSLRTIFLVEVTSCLVEIRKEEEDFL